MQREGTMKILIIGFIAIMAVGFINCLFAVNKSKDYMKNLYEGKEDYNE